jgi:hypothetical protein
MWGSSDKWSDRPVPELPSLRRNSSIIKRSLPHRDAISSAIVPITGAMSLMRLVHCYVCDSGRVQ